MLPELDVLIPTYDRPAALAATLACLSAQTLPSFRVIVSDQTDAGPGSFCGPVRAVARLLEAHGRPVELLRHLPRRGLAEQRHFLLDRSSAPYALFLDDDVLTEPNLLERLLKTIRREGCGFVGSALHGLSFLDDHRPADEGVELWRERVRPEHIEPGSQAWSRARLHSAANLYHAQQALGVGDHETVTYKVAWVGGCVLYDTAALRCCGGFEFWTQLPLEHAGEDVLAQLRVMARHGGCAIIPSGAYHQELPTTVPDRTVDAPWALR